MKFDTEEKAELRRALNARMRALQVRAAELKDADPRDTGATLHLAEVARYYATCQKLLAKF